MPLQRGERPARRFKGAAEDQGPEDGETHAGKAGQGEEGPEADLP